MSQMSEIEKRARKRSRRTYGRTPMADLDLEELKRLVAEEGARLKADLAQMRHSGLTLVNALPELIARVERAEKALAFIRDENWAWATRETPSEAPRRVYGRWSEVARTVVPEPALTGDTPNV